jgi:O-antigen ligase
MQRTSSLIRVLDGLLELGWLFILVGVPVFFNLRDYRVFEPDKIVLMRNTTLAMIVVLLIKGLYLAPVNLGRWFGTKENPPSGNVITDAKEALRHRPVVLAALIFGFIYILATITSIEPSISFWGSFDRMEGTYTYLTYITVFLIMCSHIRSWAQVERVITMVILASVPVAAYSWLQHFNNDPFVWADGNATALRTPSTMGNPIFLAAALLMAVPFTFYRLGWGMGRLVKTNPSDVGGAGQLWTILATVGYAVAALLQFGGIYFSGSRGPALGFLAGIVVFGLCVGLARHVTWLSRATIALLVLLLLVFGATNSVFKQSSTADTGISRLLHILPSESDTSEVRALLWKSAPGLFEQHPILGCGPEVLIFCWYPHFPAALRTIELANAAPDRSHNEEIDILLTTGIVGEVSYLALLAVSMWRMIVLLRRARSLRSVLVVSALMGAYVGHIVEGATGIAFSATLLLLWVIMALITALDSGSQNELTADFNSPAQRDVVTPAPAPPVHSTPPRPTLTSRSSNRQRRAAGARVADPKARRQSRADDYTFGGTLSKLKGVSTAMIALGGIVSVGIAVLCVALFVGNLQLIAADADYRLALNLEQESGTLVTQQSTYQKGLYGYQLALNSYQQSLNQVPTWGWPPPQDTYSLFFGKTLLEYAAAILVDKTNTNASAQATGAIQEALTVFTAAQHANPLNPDHPRNISKLYRFWAENLYTTPNIDKLKLAAQYDGEASALAPHNADILDEWAQIDLELGQYDKANARTWYAEAEKHLLAAKVLYNNDGAVYRDLGSVYGQYAIWDEQAGNKKAAKENYQLQVNVWLLALKYGATSGAQIYAPLANVYRLELNNLCEAAVYANDALNAITSGAITDTDGSIKVGMQQILAQAAADSKCRAKSP